MKEQERFADSSWVKGTFVVYLVADKLFKITSEQPQKYASLMHIPDEFLMIMRMSIVVNVECWRDLVH